MRYACSRAPTSSKRRRASPPWPSPGPCEWSMSGTPIARVHARRVWDSRGRPTVEAEVTLEGGAMGRAIAPAGASLGAREAVDLRDGGTRFGGLDVSQAIAHVNAGIAKALAGLDACNQ